MTTSEGLTFFEVCSGAEPQLDVVFIHGLTGDPKDTWISEADGQYWPEWLCSDFPGIAVHALGYPAGVFEKWAKKEMDLFERATNALEYMAAKGLGARPIVFICHSLGGILAKQIIRKSCDSEDEDWKKVSQAIKLVVFLSTPHSGASLASALKAAIPHFASKHVELLSNDSGFLQDINSHYRSFANGKSDLTTVVYYEKYKVKNTTLVVSRDSSDPGVAGTTPVPADKDHISICKPKDANDIVYLGIKKHISRVADEECKAIGAGSFQPDDYSSKSGTDRRDLLEKLIAAGREHEYAAANNYQNKFAQNYLKLGLFTTARDENDKLLSEVEQRFITHIYHPLICKGESDEKIRDALQSQVIDPLCKQHDGQKGFSGMTVLSALYFLTEQCHIRWDADS